MVTHNHSNISDEDWQINLMLWNLTFPMECKEQLKFAHNLSHELFLPQERKAAILSFQLSMKWHFRKMVISLLDNLTIMKAVPQYTSSYIPDKSKCIFNPPTECEWYSTKKVSKVTKSFSSEKKVSCRSWCYKFRTTCTSINQFSFVQFKSGQP